MSRLFIRIVARWTTIGIISIFAVGGFPAIAAACEGAGEELIIKTSFGEEKGNPKTGTNQNPFELEAEILNITAEAGKGGIVGGTCVVGKRYKSLETCTVVQAEPVGNLVEWNDV
jgi:hypothetical protein